MIFWYFEGEDTTSETGAYTVVVAANNKEQAKSIATELLIQKQRQDLIPELTLTANRTRWQDNPVIYNNVEARS